LDSCEVYHNDVFTEIEKEIFNRNYELGSFVWSRILIISDLKKIFVRILRKSVVEKIFYFLLAEKLSYIILLTAYIVITDKEKERAVILEKFTNFIDFTILISEVFWGEEVNAISFIFNIRKLDAVIKFAVDISNNVRI
jgi:hypothetical protein